MTAELQAVERWARARDLWVGDWVQYDWGDLHQIGGPGGHGGHGVMLGANVDAMVAGLTCAACQGEGHHVYQSEVAGTREVTSGPWGEGYQFKTELHRVECEACSGTGAHPPSSTSRA